MEPPPVTALFSVLSYVMSNCTRQTFLWVLLLELTWWSRRCILWWPFYRCGLYLWEGRSRSTFHMQCYNMLQSSWLLDHSSPLKRQINPWAIHHSVFGVAVKSFNTLQVSFPSSNFAGEEIQLRALHKGLKIHVLFSLPKKCFTALERGPLKFCTLSSLRPVVVGKPSPARVAEPNSSRRLPFADSTEKGQWRGGSFSRCPAFLGVISQNFQ